MGLNTIIGLLCVVAALVLYSLGTWGAFRAKAMGQRHATLIAVGVAFDAIATAAMGWKIGGLDLSKAGMPHTVAGLIALAAMFAIALTAWMALKKSDAARLTALAKLTLAPYAFWILVFLWGMSRSRG